LLLEHALRIKACLGLPGGYVALGEHPEDTARREVREETGLELTQLSLAFVRTLVPDAWIEIVFRARAEGTPVPDGVEIIAARWVPVGELPPDLEVELRDVILHALGVTER